MPEKMNLCKKCKWAKDNWHESCYCVYYGYIVWKGKKECWGYDISEKVEEDEQTDNHRQFGKGS